MTLGRLAMFASLIALPAAAARAQGQENPHGPGIGACAVCHTPSAWKPARIGSAFKHTEKVFPLDGAHARTSCLACHKSLEFSKAQAACGSCHSDVHKGELGAQCARCHTTRSFVDQGQMRRMHELTLLPLRGAHAALTCDACHTPTASGQAQYVDRPATCYACHAADYRATNAPNHFVAQFTTECSSCHGSATWLNAQFDHSVTHFALTGAHKAVACTSCHGDNVYRGKSNACVSCHQQNYATAMLPPHASLAFPTVCASCHNTTVWMGAAFDHNATAFPLTGAHQTVTCTGCHADGVYRGKATACAGCHQANYAATAAPPHAASGFAMTCESCHGTVTWAGAVFNHSNTRFPLTGVHVTTPCSSCHADGVYQGKSTACASCHQSSYTLTTNPPHAASGFPLTCEVCHTTASWLTAIFDHSTTLFPLTGVHQSTPCASCHGDGVYKGKSTVCASCHQSSYNSTTAPPHAAAGFPTTCGTCHSTTSWLTATFDHSTTGFPLTGGHLTTPCISCHGDGVYHGKSTLCYSCHQPQYTATTAPPHAAAGFQTACETCHTTASWLTATFNHSTTKFPLTGMHATQPCSACHGDGVYVGKSTLCSSCHLTDYNGTNNPAHSAAGFPTTCDACHTTSTWLGATFNHDASFFPIYSGTHKGRWSLCTDCHTNSSNYAAFSCFQCHAQTTTTNGHKNVPGFKYDSPSCYACHPKGSAG